MAPFPLKNLATAQLNYTKVRKLNKTKKSSLVFGNRLGEFFLSLTCPHSQMCIGICIFDFRKQTSKKKQEYRKRPRHATLLKKRLWHRCFPVNFAKVLRKPFLQNIPIVLIPLIIPILVPFLLLVWYHGSFSVDIYLFKINIRNTRKMCEIRSKLTIKATKWRHGVILMFLLLTSNMFYNFF